MNKHRAAFLILIPLLALSACKEGSKPQEGKTAATPETAPAAPLVRAKSSSGAKVFLIEPKNGATVSNPVAVKFGAEGIAVAKATDGVHDNSGHHHILLDLDHEPAFDQVLPSNANILHYGQGQSETILELAPGTHTLQLLMAGGNHVPHDPPVMSEKITITVK